MKIKVAIPGFTADKSIFKLDSYFFTTFYDKGTNDKPQGSEVIFSLVSQPLNNCGTSCESKNGSEKCCCFQGEKCVSSNYKCQCEDARVGKIGHSGGISKRDFNLNNISSY